MKRLISAILALWFTASSFAQDKVCPLEGEGLWAFYSRVGLNTKELRDQFFVLNKGRFGKDSTLLTGVYYKIPHAGDAKITTNAEQVTTVDTTKKLKKVAVKDKVCPLEGEGLWAFYARVGLDTKDLRDVFLDINQGRFGKDASLLTGVYYKIPTIDDIVVESAPVAKDQVPMKPQKSDVIEKLFGKDYERVPVTSKELDGAVFYLVSGHGGPDPGAIGKFAGHELHEDEYAYDVILRLGRQLMMRGAKVNFIIQDKVDGIRDDQFLSTSRRETCMGAQIPLDQVKRLKQRCDKINALYKKDGNGYRRAVFIHLDSRSERKRIDIFLYHAKGSKKGKMTAESIRTTLEDKYAQHQPNRGFEGTVSRRDLFVLTETNPPSVFFELGNIQNVQDQQRFIRTSNREAMAKWIAEGFVKDYKIQKQIEKNEKERAEAKKKKK